MDIKIEQIDSKEEGEVLQVVCTVDGIACVINSVGDNTRITYGNDTIEILHHLDYFYELEQEQELYDMAASIKYRELLIEVANEIFEDLS